MMTLEGHLTGKKRFHFDNLYFDVPREYEYIILYQIGDLSSENGYEVPEHVQFCYEISYISSGQGWFYINGREYKVKTGDIFINIPGEKHRIKSGDQFRYFYIGFNFKHANNENSLIHIENMFKNITVPVISDKYDISIPFLNTLKELRNIREFSHLLIKSYINQILILTYRNHFLNSENKYDFNNNYDNTKEIVYSAINYIDSNLLRIIELNQISEVLGYSYSYLSHIFKEETGLTLQSYISGKKLQLAIKLIKEGEKTITEISQMLHYQSIHSFSKAFKKSVGISPNDYRKSYCIE